EQLHLNLSPTSPFSDSKINIYSPIGSNNATPYCTFETALSSPLTLLSDELAEDLLNNFHLFTPSPSPSATPPPPPTPIQSNMAAPARHMPFHSQNSAPTLVTGSNGVPELTRFFTDVEYLFEDCQINADADKKRHILRYLELQDSWLWESLPTFAAGTYAAWKNEVWALYSGTSEERRYSANVPNAADKGKGYVPPDTRNLGALPDKPRADLAYRTFAPIVDPLKSGAVFE
ncbi:hypothetical protein H0H81_005367, partial [Sphagnurus paluster]